MFEHCDANASNFLIDENLEKKVSWHIASRLDHRLTTWRDGKQEEKERKIAEENDDQKRERVEDGKK